MTDPRQKTPAAAPDFGPEVVLRPRFEVEAILLDPFIRSIEVCLYVHYIRMGRD